MRHGAASEKSPIIRTNYRHFRRSADESELQNTIGELMHTEIDLGFTFCQIAAGTRNVETRLRNRRNARKAYDTVARFVRNKKMSRKVVRAVSERLPLLRAKLVQLGEVFA